MRVRMLDQDNVVDFLIVQEIPFLRGIVIEHKLFASVVPMYDIYSFEILRDGECSKITESQRPVPIWAHRWTPCTQAFKSTTVQLRILLYQIIYKGVSTVWRKVCTFISKLWMGKKGRIIGVPVWATSAGLKSAGLKVVFSPGALFFPASGASRLCNSQETNHVMRERALYTHQVIYDVNLGYGRPSFRDVAEYFRIITFRDGRVRIEFTVCKTCGPPVKLKAVYVKVEVVSNILDIFEYNIRLDVFEISFVTTECFSIERSLVGFFNFVQVETPQILV